MKVIICKDERSFDIAGAWRIIGELLEKPDAVIGLCTGQTTINMYGIIAEIHKKYPFDVSLATLFNVDEYVNVPPDYAGSCYNTIYNQLVRPLGIREENFIMPSTMSDNFEAECLEFERRLAERDTPDLQILGIGMNGHIAMIQPGAPFESETWVSHLEADDEIRIRRETGVGPETELGGLTRGIRNIMQTRKIILIAKGPCKADIIGQALLGPVTTDVPASVLQLHPDCEVLLDEAAAAKVKDLL